MKINKGQFSLSTADKLKFDLRRGNGSLFRFAINRVKWHLFPRMHLVPDFPDHVDIEISTLCNMKCPMCYTTTEEYKKNVPRQFMPFSLYKKIVDECARYNIYSIRLSLRGESLIHPDVVSMVAYAKKQGIREIATLTNGLILTPELFEQLLEAGLTWLTISVDGMDEIYERIRKPARFSEILATIKACHTIKQQHHSIHPVIKVQSIWPAIKDDPTRFYETFAPYVDLVASNPLIDYLGKDDESIIIYEEDFDCPVLYQRFVIGSDGSVLLCSNDEMGKYIIGDVNSESIYSIWHGVKIQNARDLHRIHVGYREIEPCIHCYLPRMTKPVIKKIGDKEVIVDEYIGRSDKIGE